VIREGIPLVPLQLLLSASMAHMKYACYVRPSGCSRNGSQVDITQTIKCVLLLVVDPERLELLSLFLWAGHLTWRSVTHTMLIRLQVWVWDKKGSIKCLHVITWTVLREHFLYSYQSHACTSAESHASWENFCQGLVQQSAEHFVCRQWSLQMRHVLVDAVSCVHNPRQRTEENTRGAVHSKHR
jgi:hypothetical protein